MGNRDNFGKVPELRSTGYLDKDSSGKEYALQSAACHIQAGQRQGKDSYSEWRSVKWRAGRCRNAGRNRRRLHIAFRYLSECHKPQEEVRKQVFSMKVELDKTGMVHLVSGTYPSHDMQEALQNRNLGYRENDVWHWDSEELRKLDNPQLYTLYKELRY